MSSVKANVIRIVNGLPPEEPKNLVELKADEQIVPKAESNVGAFVGTLHFERRVETPEPSPDATGISVESLSEFFKGGEVPEGTPYLVGEQPHGQWIPKPYKPEPNLEFIPGLGWMPFGVKPYVKFKMGPKNLLVPGDLSAKGAAIELFKLQLADQLPRFNGLNL